MQLPLVQIDAFADAPFTGNPAAVMPLPCWLPDGLLQQLAEAEPAVLEAQAAVSNIKKPHLTEVRSMANPPAAVKSTMESVCILLGHHIDGWKSVQGILRRDDFIASVVRLDTELLASYTFDYVILDESQAIKNPSSTTSQAVRQLRSRHRLILTGTPVENSTMDLWSQMSFINPGLLGTQAFFRKEFLKPIEKDQNEDRTRRLHALIKPFILRRHKAQVAKELPEKTEHLSFCPMTEEQAQAYEETKSFYRNKILSNLDEHGSASTQFLLLQGLTRLRQIANHPHLADEAYTGESGKLREVLRMLRNVVAEGHKVLVFSQFVQHLLLVRNALDERQISYAYLDGNTRDRQAEVDRFQQTDDLQIFLISLKAGGVGLNLTAADYVFILDPWWNPAVEAQAVDRAHRIGQQRPVFVYKFITQGTVEEKILALQRRKLALVSELIATDEAVIKSLTREDIEELLG